MKLISDAGTIASDISDHCPIFLLYTSKGIKYDHASITAQHVSDEALEVFKHDIRAYDWSFIFQLSDVNEAYEAFLDRFSSMYAAHFPFKTFKPSKRIRKPWVTSVHLSMIKKKNKLYHIFLRTREAQALKEFKTARNKLNSELRRAKKSYYEQQFSKIPLNRADAVWKVLNNVLNRRKQHFLPEHIVHNNQCLSGAELANHFNRYFTNIPVPCSDLSFRENGIACAESFFLVPTDEIEICRTFISLNNSKALDIDNFQIRPIKHVLESIAPILAYVFNLAMVTGVFPRKMKRSRVSVLFKGGDKNVAANYRPISVIPIFSKGFEKILHSRFTSFFNKMGALSDAQHGFRKGRSTETALLALKESVLTNIEHKLITLGLFIDFSKAFDSLDHSILTEKLSLHGVRGTALAFMKSYLEDRYQYVHIGNHKSSLLSISKGVPQGSVLGPLMFNIYINSIVNIDNTGKFIIYADDSTILLSGSNTNDLGVKCNILISKLIHWSLCNRISINPAKTKVMFFRARNKVVKLDIPIMCLGKEIEIVDEYKTLGITFSSTLAWDAHVEKLCKRLSSTAGALSRCRALLPTKIKLQIYYALFASHINYCSLVWLTTTKSNINKIFLLQKKVIRHVVSIDYFAPTLSHFQTYNIITAENMYNFRILRSFYRSSPAFIQFLVTSSALERNNHPVNTRNSDNWLIPHFRTEYKNQMLQHNLPSVLNKYGRLCNPTLKELREIFVNM